MIKNYIITAIRNITRFKLHSFINIGGLAIGISIFTLIMIYVISELSYDKYHENYEKIYQVSIQKDLATTAHLGYMLKEKFPEMKYLVRSTVNYGGGEKAYLNLLDSDTHVEFENILYASPDFFNLFSIEVIAGDISSALANPYTIVLTESTAIKLFGSTDIVNKTIGFISGEGSIRHTLTITAIIADAPENSSVKYSGITSFITLNDIKPGGVEVDQDYFNWGYSTYIILNDKVDKDAFLKKARAEFVEFLCEKYEIDPTSDEANEFEMEMVPFNEVPFYENNKLQFIYLIVLIGFIIIIIAIINFINLSLAKSSLRSKEIGLRKVAGSSRTNLIEQFIGEATVLVFIAVIVSIILTEILKPFFNTMVGKDLSIGYIDKPQILLIFLAGTIIIGLLAGFYPAIILSRYNPVKTIKNELTSGKKGHIFKQSLSIIQISVALVLIIGAIIISKQINYMKTKDIGFDNSNLIYFQSNDFINEKYDLFKEELLQNPNITILSRAGNEFGGPLHMTMTKEINGVKISFQAMIADPDFVETMGLQIVKGRKYEWDRESDMGAMIINETAAREFGVDTAIGLKMEKFNDHQEVIGIYKDVYSESFHQEITPCVMMNYGMMLHKVIIKINEHNKKETIKHIKNVWQETVPDVPFTYNFLNEKYDELYKTEVEFGLVIKFSALFSVFIACLGLFGMISFTSERRKKEIGIRKANGASAVNILMLLNKGIVKWVGIATIIASPIAYYATDKWLQNFAFRTSINIGVFVFAVLIVLSIALISVSIVVFKATKTNPADCLRYE
ncbi:MAG: ABC transporter permease [Bacteroidales bacterium]|nr:ABC transporter permease [Bacteroidales bacterium]